MSAAITLGFIGLGLMGGPMATNLCRAGYKTRVWNRTAAKAAKVVEAGGQLCDSPRDVARDCDVVFLCLFDTAAVEEIAFGKNGIAEVLPRGACIVDHSTIDPGATAEFSTRLAAEYGVGFVDAPVTGGVTGAQAGTLTIFGGGDVDSVERVRPFVMEMCSRFEHLGRSGSGQAAKVCNQIMVQTTIAAAAEMVKLAESNDMDVKILLDLLASGVAGSPILDLMGKRMIERSEEVSGPLRVAVKDLDIIQAAGKTFGVGLPMSGLATELYRMAASKGLADKDNSQVIRIYD